MYIISLFIIISVLFAVEASTSLARVAGLKAKNLASGLQLQSGLSLFSRALMAVFMPSLGALSDSGRLSIGSLKLVCWGNILVPTSILLVCMFRIDILQVYFRSVLNLVKNGSYLPTLVHGAITHQVNIDKKIGKKFASYRFITLISYLPYYLSWPVIIILLSIFPEDRGLIIGLSSVMNGINTLALILYVDPFLIRLSKHEKLSQAIYFDQLKLRLTAATVPALLLIVGSFFMGFNN